MTSERYCRRLSPMQFMKEEEIWALLKGQEDILTPAANARAEFFKKQRCPQCGGPCTFELTEQHVKGARADEPVPYGHGRCTMCRCMFDPDTRVILEVGKPTNAVEQETGQIVPIRHDD